MKGNTMKELIKRANKAIAESKGECFCEDEEAKKLTTKDRKSLKSSTFCGPGRSFPITDCQHVGTARAYLGRSKFSESTKKKISACINRKAKQLGCDKEKSSIKFIELSYEQKQLYSSDIFKATKELVEESIKNPGVI